MGRLDGKIAIITGAQAAWEKHSALLAAEGAKVVMTDMQESGARIAAELGDSLSSSE